MNADSQRDLRNAFATFMTGVTVVTAESGDGTPVGFTANSFTSVSLDPPLLLVCIGKSLSCFPVFETCESFAVNILSEDQQDISDRFARYQGDRFEDIAWQQSAEGNPLITGVSAWFDCKTFQRTDAGDHLVLIGEIRDFFHGKAQGLGYCRSGYFRLGLEQQASELQAREKIVSVGAIVASGDSVLVLPGSDGYLTLPETRLKNLPGTQRALRSNLVKSGVSIEFGPVYSIFENEETGDHTIFYRSTAAGAISPKNAQFVPVEQLEIDRFERHSIRSMMQRYVEESRTNLFGVYYGTELEGQVEKLAQPQEG